MGMPPNVYRGHFRSPGGTEKTDLGGGKGGEFPLETPRERDARETLKPELEDPQVLEKCEEGGNRTPETSACRHDPGGSWLAKNSHHRKT
ncbi:hypothetical protein NDU88_001995 [Pleurodeles waltl]|uniref:Uncharacterized protein n=1 Tax=Pleurodeles waltl TaxID=8319 RepID=A0AAV7SDP0_PLEWA|nr:hypothetical protein NDU88_001995 [Pleurodeles waltl]